MGRVAMLLRAMDDAGAGARNAAASAQIVRVAPASMTHASGTTGDLDEQIFASEPTNEQFSLNCAMYFDSFSGLMI